MKNRKKYYILEHSRPYSEDDYYDETRIIGIFSSKKKAIEVKKSLLDKPGFRDYPGDYENDSQGFYIGECIIGENHWCEGFIDD